MTILDENLKLNCLPKYVADSPDSMPSIRIYDGDLLSIMMAFEKLRERMSSAEVTLSAILQAVSVTKDMLTTLPVHASRSVPPVVQSLPDDGVDINNSGIMSRAVRDTQLGRNETAALGNSKQTSADADYSWANDMAAVSSPVMISNRFSVFQRSDDNDCGDVEGSDSQSDNPYVEQRSRRKRRRQQSMLQQAHQRQGQQQPHPQNSRAGAAGTAVQQCDAQRGDLHNAVERQRRDHVVAASDRHGNAERHETDNVNTNSSSVQRGYAAATASGAPSTSGNRQRPNNRP